MVWFGKGTTSTWRGLGKDHTCKCIKYYCPTMAGDVPTSDQKLFCHHKWGVMLGNVRPGCLVRNSEWKHNFVRLQQNSTGYLVRGGVLNYIAEPIKKSGRNQYNRGKDKLSVNSICVHKQCSQCSYSCVETLVILRAKFHVVSSLFSVLNSDFDAIVKVPLALGKWASPKNEIRVNLKSASFVVIMFLHEGLTHIHSQKSLSCIWARVSL